MLNQSNYDLQTMEINLKITKHFSPHNVQDYYNITSLTMFKTHRI